MSGSPTKRLLLFSGMGGDSELMRPIQVPGLSVVTPDHLPPNEAETLPAYAKRVADLNSIGAEDIVGGASFGGMLAAEIAKQRRVKALVMLGSCLQPKRLPRRYRWVERMSRYVPDFVLAIRRFRPTARWRFRPISEEALSSVIAQAARTPPSQIRGIARMIMGWEGAEQVACPVLSIHGDKDKIIPLACALPSLVLKEAGHAFTLTHAPQTIAAIADFVKAL